MRGEIYKRLKRWEDAKAAFKEALKIDLESPGPLLGLARSALAAKNYKAAVRYARESIGLLFFQPRGHYIHGVALYRLGRWDNAEHAFLLCVRQAPLFSAAFRMLGEIARWHKKDSAEQALYQVAVLETRRRLKELRQQRASEMGGLGAMTEQGRDRPMPAVQPHPETIAGVPAEEIIVVSGLPRSGTSLMMQILDAAGIPPFTDLHSPSRRLKPKRLLRARTNCLFTLESRQVLDQSRKGYGNQSRRTTSRQFAAQTEETKSKSEPLHYRVLFMERDMEEILQSQERMLQRLGKSSGTVEKGANISRPYRQQERHAKSWCATLGIHAMSVSFDDVVHYPDKILLQIADFPSVADKIPAMRAYIDPALHRSRKFAALNPK